MAIEHKRVEPAILYFGTPVVLISTLNEDGSVNFAPMSSVWWLGWTAMIGLDPTSQTTQNIMRTGECVLNLPSDDLVAQVNRLAKTTGTKRLPTHKVALGYRYVADKLEKSGLTTVASDEMRTPRIAECKIQLEAKLAQQVSIAKNSPRVPMAMSAFELDILAVHADKNVLVHPKKSYIDPDKWHPLIMSFRKFYGTREYIHPAKLAEGSENLYAIWKARGGVRQLLEKILVKDS